MSIFELMAAPFAECLVLVGIHTYLGIHVLRRRVIFVDLALAQIAALGTMVGFLFGIMPETTAALLVSMAFAFFGAAVFALTRIRSDRIPQEAVIGLVYAITAAIAVLVVEKTQGGEHLKEIMVGCILWVKWSDVGAAAAAYSLVGVVHFVFRKQFFLLSEDPDEAYRRGMSVRLWDFFFYVTFGFVIAFSTRVAGVLLVFVFLVAPAIMAFMITDRLRTQLIIGWVMGTVVTIAGLLSSYVVDLPSGPTVVAFYGIALALGAVVIYLVRVKERGRAVLRVAVGVLCAAGLCAAFVIGACWLSTTALAVSAEHQHVQQEIQRQQSATRHRAHGPASRSVPALPGAEAGDSKLRPCKAYQRLTDAEQRLALIRKVSKSCKRGGLRLLAVFLSDPDTAPFFRAEGVDLLKEVAGESFGYDADQDPQANAHALQEMRQHIKSITPTGRSPAIAGSNEAYGNCFKDC